MPTGPTVTPPSSDGPLSTLAYVAADWQRTKHQAAALTVREKALNHDISAVIEQLGEPDDKGHVWVQGLSFEGWEKGHSVTFNALQRQRRVSLTMDDETAASILKAKRILKRCSTSYIQVTDTDKAIAALQAAGLLDNSGFEVVTQISEEKVRDAYFDEILTEADYNAIFQSKITWALLPARL